MADEPKSTHLCDPDPWDMVDEARGQRGPIVAGWLRAVVARTRSSHLVSPATRRLGADEHVPAAGRLAAAAALLPLAAGYFLSYLFRNVNGVVAGDIMRDLGIGADALGLLTSVYFLTFATAQLPVGVLLDRYGPRRIQCGLLLCAAAGAGLCALDAGFVGLLLGRALIGLGTAGGLVAGLKASAQWFPRERLAIVNGMFIMCGGLGALAATWPVEILLQITDWRGLSAVLAIAAGTVALAIGRVVPDQGQVSTHVGEVIRLGDVMRDPLVSPSRTAFRVMLRHGPSGAGPLGRTVAGRCGGVVTPRDCE